MLTTDYLSGSPNWIDLGSPDTGAAAAFYQAVLGWGYQSAGPDSGGYGFFTLDGKTVAALGPLTEEGAASAWTVYFATPDADATAKAVEDAGGTVRVGPMDVFTAGRTAAFTDPTGAQFAVWQPGETRGLDAVTVPGTLCWTELYAGDHAVATTFYASVFGWQTREAPMPGMTYTLVRPAGTEEGAELGGIMPISPEMSAGGVTPRWQPYFEAADCDAVVAAAQGHGGKLLMGPVDLPGVGRLAQLLDPFGAPFALITSAAE